MKIKIISHAVLIFILFKSSTAYAQEKLKYTDFYITTPKIQEMIKFEANNVDIIKVIDERPNPSNTIGKEYGSGSKLKTLL